MRVPIPAATIARLPVYLRCLSDLGSVDEQCSSDELAAAAGVNSAQVRKDFSYLGSYGKRGVGYDIDDLTAQLRKVLGLTRTHPVMIVGAGNLGTALANYKGIDTWGFDIASIVDIDNAKIGRTVDGLTVESVDDIARIVTDRSIEIGIITTPASAAQGIAERFADAGVTSILNFAPTVLRPPEGVTIRRVDIATSLGILAFHRTDEGRIT
ncbi:MAG: redox-sensing transcriptional repressor Rex [Actinomycetota bacterium]